MSEVTEPQFLDETEALIGPFLPDPQQADILYYQGVNNFPTASIDMAQPIYTGALRILAAKRHRDRSTVGSLTNTQIVDWNTAWQDELTATRLAGIAADTDRSPLIKQLDRLHRLNIVATQDTAEQTMAIQPRTQAVERPLEDLREHQSPYYNDIISFMDKPPVEITVILDKEPENFRVHGAVVIAPTGGGKSLLAGKTVGGANIGKPRKNDPSTTTCALLVVPSVMLAEQFTGKVGDDSFRRSAPEHITVSMVTGRDKTGISGNTDVTVTTIDQFVEHARQGTFYGREYDLLIIDEVHHLTEPKFKRTFLEQWRRPASRGGEPIPTVGFTATADYNQEKDVRHLLPYDIEHADTLSYMQDGILNGGQFFLVKTEADYTDRAVKLLEDGAKKWSQNTYKEIRREIMAQAMVDFFQPLLLEGRRGIIFCDAGDEAAAAKDLAARLRHIQLPNGRFVGAEPISSFYKDKTTSSRLIDDYNKKKLQVLTSVDMGREGLNADFDFVGVGNVFSLLKLRQIMGRGTRQSTVFPTTIYAQFISDYITHSAKGKTFFEALGLDTVEQGIVISPKVAAPRTSRLRREAAKTLRLDDFSDNTRALINKINHRVLAEIGLEAQEIPEDYVHFDRIYAFVKDKLSEKSAKYRLDAAGYTWRGRILKGKGQGTFTERYYEPSAASFFSENPLPPKAEGDLKTLSATVKELGVSKAFLTKLYSRLHTNEGLTAVSRLGANGVPTTFYDPTIIRRFKEEVAKIPVAESTDTSLTPLAKKLCINEETMTKHAKELGIVSVYKRRYGGKGFTWFITKGEATKLKQRTEKYPWATTQDWNIVRIARQVGADRSIITQVIKGEGTDGTILRTKTAQGYTRELRHWREDVALRIIDAFKNRYVTLPAHLIPYKVATTITATLASRPPESLVGTEETTLLPLPGTRPILCLTWEGLKKLHNYYGLRQNAPAAPDYSKLPTGPDDSDETRIIYARAYQLQFMTAARMGNPDGIID